MDFPRLELTPYQFCSTAKRPDSIHEMDPFWKNVLEQREVPTRSGRLPTTPPRNESPFLRHENWSLFAPHVYHYNTLRPLALNTEKRRVYSNYIDQDVYTDSSGLSCLGIMTAEAHKCFHMENHIENLTMYH
jgi:hypothetical protein